MVGIEISNSDYHSGKEVGSTTFKTYMDNPVKAYKTYMGLIESTSSVAMDFGSLVHCLALEPETFNDEFMISDEKIKEPSERLINPEKQIMVYPEKFLTPSGNLSTAKKVAMETEEYRMSNDEFLFATPIEIYNLRIWMEAKGKTIVTQKSIDEAKVIAQKALDYEFSITINSELYNFTFQDAIDKESAIMERAFYAWINEDLTVTLEPKSDRAIRVKTKPDILIDLGHDNYIVVDLKTADTASVKDFEKTAKLFYHLQEAHYTKILEANGIKVFKFIFLMAGKQKWSGCQQYEYDRPAKELGEEHFERAVKMHIIAMEDGEVRETSFDGEKYEREPVLSLPAYMFYK